MEGVANTYRGGGWAGGGGADAIYIFGFSRKQLKHRSQRNLSSIFFLSFSNSRKTVGSDNRRPLWSRIRGHKQLNHMVNTSFCKCKKVLTITKQQLMVEEVFLSQIRNGIIINWKRMKTWMFLLLYKRPLSV